MTNGGSSPNQIINRFDQIIREAPPASEVRVVCLMSYGDQLVIRWNSADNPVVVDGQELVNVTAHLIDKVLFKPNGT